MQERTVLHIPDGFLNGATSAGTAVVAAGGLGYSIKRAGAYLQDNRIALTGLIAAFIFALQMINFPVGAGTSGHLLGGALAVILVGPWLGITAVSVVVIVQALLLADGGVSALGVNILNMALVTGFVGWAVFRIMVRLLPRSWTTVLVSTFTAALASVVVSSIAFVIEYALGGRGNVEFGTVLAAMAGFHFLIGIGEGLISAATVGAVAATRPELIAGVQDLDLVDKEKKKIRAGAWGFAAAGLTVAALLVLVVAPLASVEPDGLERVAIDEGFIDSAEDHALNDSPLADYGVSGIEDEATGTRLSGLIGVLVTFGVGAAIVAAFVVMRKRSTTSL
ncbi:MAG TPA: energy-coupling factor ABC transporter permease [Acidimicrobiia bacterium]|nr:energy-coupling factor ABC transporter permease [Acidimicrobiia bacterium]